VLIPTLKDTRFGRNAAGEPFANEMSVRACTAEYEGGIVLTEMKETLDPKAE
jgi:hypothetical protein